MHGVRSTIAAFKAMIKEVEYQEDILEDTPQDTPQDTYHLMFILKGGVQVFQVKTNKPLPKIISDMSTLILKNPTKEMFIEDRNDLQNKGEICVSVDFVVNFLSYWLYTD